MIHSIGVDLIEIERIRQAIERNGQRFIDRVYTDAEQAYCSQRSSYACYAARFTAKEAFLKAFGTGLRKGCAGAISKSVPMSLANRFYDSTAFCKSNVKTTACITSIYHYPTARPMPLPKWSSNAKTGFSSMPSH